MTKNKYIKYLIQIIIIQIILSVLLYPIYNFIGGYYYLIGFPFITAHWGGGYFDGNGHVSGNQFYLEGLFLSFIYSVMVVFADNLIKDRFQRFLWLFRMIIFLMSVILFLYWTEYGCLGYGGDCD